jgi:glycine/D-amino acid oxidase-like deaminating enzyme
MPAITEKNFWLTTVTPAASNSPPNLPERSDVVIVGAGFTGLSAALALARRGLSTVVLEARTAGWGASSRNGGMVLTGLKLPVPTLVKRYGLEVVRRMYAASLESIGLVEQIAREENIQCDFSACGHLEVACKRSHFADYAASAERLQREFGHTLRIVPKSDLPTEIGSNIYFGGLVDDSSASLNPARFVAGLAQAAERKGAQVFEHFEVQAIDRQASNGSGIYRVRTSRGTLTAREVLLASGAYTSGYAVPLRQKIIPIGSYIIVTQVLPPALARELSPRNRMIYDSKHFLYYYRLTPDNRMLFGGRAAFFPETESTVRQSAEILRRGMVTVYPQLRDIGVEFAWGGTLDFAFDVMPHSGTLDGMHFALGYAGHGVAAATWMGARLADVICGVPVENPFAKISFPTPPIGLRAGNTWALPLAGAYYKILDWLT